MKTYYTILISMLLISQNFYAQTTAIPDPAFEQALIDFNIDSDATVNGQVLTSDINTVEHLDISNLYLDEITGIEDFTALKTLDISYSQLYNQATLNLSSLTNLEELYMNDGGDHINILVSYLDLSGNPNLKIIQTTNAWLLNTINLKNSDLQLNNLDLTATSDSSICIEVGNPSQAQNGQGVYSTWDICCNVSFSSDCSLSTEKIDQNLTKIYPNPANQTFSLATTNPIDQLLIYDLKGKLVSQFKQAQKSYAINHLDKGVYVVKIITGKKSIAKKLIVE